MTAFGFFGFTERSDLAVFSEPEMEPGGFRRGLLSGKIRGRECRLPVGGNMRNDSGHEVGPKELGLKELQRYVIDKEIWVKADAEGPG